MSNSKDTKLDAQKQSLVLESAIEGLKPQTVKAQEFSSKEEESSEADTLETFTDYATQFLTTTPITSRRYSIVISSETFQLLKQTLILLTGGEGFLGGYVENILRDHFTSYRDLINRQITARLAELGRNYSSDTPASAK